MKRKRNSLKGKCKELEQMAIEAGLKPRTVLSRVYNYGWTIEEALARPVRPFDTEWDTRGTKVCSICEEEKSTEDFNKIQRRGGRRLEILPACKVCNNARNKAYRAALRLEILTHYTGGSLKCELCPESRVQVLDLDHVNGLKGGRNARKTTTSVYLEAKREGFPDTFRVLCRNCNWLEYLKRTGKGD